MADLFGTYDKRIKITIDHTKIDSDLSWFPVTVFLTSSQGEEVFTEFDADEDFDRIAFTSSDGETQLYADCELFDVSENKAIYHVSKSGWTVSSSTDTDIYLYYDNTAGHNTTYISKSGGTAAQSVWDSNFKAVYHMQDVETPTGTEQWDDGFEDNNLTEYTAGAIWGTATDQVKTGTYSAKATAAGTYDQSDATLERTTGTSYNYAEIEFDWRTDDNQYGNYIYYRYPDFYFRIGTGYFQYYNGSSLSNLPVSTTVSANTWYHIKLYHDSVNDIIMIWIDGNFKGTITDISIPAWDGFKTVTPYPNLSINTWIDNLKYTTYDEPAYGVVDATSNENFGAKAGSTEATGQVGQGQDFDGTDDKIEVADDADFDTGSYNTTELIFKTTTENQSQKGLVCHDYSSYKYMLYLTGNSGQFDFYLRTASGVKAASDSQAENYYADGNWRYMVGTFDKTLGSSRLILYRNGTSVATDNGYNEDISAGDEGITMGYWNTNYFDGDIDEVRISSNARFAAWIAATYDSLWDTLLTYTSYNHTKKSISGSVSSTGSILKDTTKTLAGILDSSGIIEKGKILVQSLFGGLNLSGRITQKAITKTILGTMDFVGSILNFITKILTGIVGFSGAVSSIRMYYRLISGILTSSGNLTKKITGKFLRGSLSLTGRLLYWLERIFGSVSWTEGTKSDESWTEESKENENWEEHTH